MNAKGGVPYMAYTTVGQCWTFCAQTPSCVGISFNAQSTLCQEFFAPTNIANTFALNGTNLYVANRAQGKRFLMQYDL